MGEPPTDSISDAMKKLGVFLLVFGASALFNRADLSSVDEGFIFNTTAALVEKQSFQMDEQLSGRKYSRFSPLPSFFAAPFYAVANKVIGTNLSGDKTRRHWLLVATGLSSCALTAWTALALFVFFRSLGYSEDTASWTSYLWAFATLAFPYSSSLFHQVFATLLMVYTCRFALAGRVVAVVIASALLVSIQLTLAVAILPLFLRGKGDWDRRTLFGLSTGILLGFGIHSLTNWLRGDHWLIGAYETETFTTPTFVGAVGLFFSSGKGLIWFAPLAFVGMLMLIPLADRRPEIGRPLLFAVVCHCIVVIHWWAWQGSLSWGPRLLLPILPLTMTPIADFLELAANRPVWQRRLLGSLAAFSLWINLWAALNPMIGFLDVLPPSSMSEWMFVPSFSPLWTPPSRALVRPENSIYAIILGITAIAVWRLSPAWRNGVPLRSLAPWRTLFVVIVVQMIGHDIHLFDDRNLSHGDERYGVGRLQFPIRGVYRLEFDGRDGENFEVAGRRLSTSNPSLTLEAPPMSVLYRVPTNNGRARLLWTIPGEGQYRSPIPAESFTDEAGRRRNYQFLLEHWSLRWLLYLFAVLFYFDWLLGGRRMKEANEVGTEAKT